MKIRSGFVSNSSSCSFILISKEDIDLSCKKASKERDYLSVNADDGTSYNRSNIRVISTLEEKIKYIVILYAIGIIYECRRDPNKYFFKMINIYRKIRVLCKKYNYFLSLEIPKLGGFIENSVWNKELNKSVPCEPYIEYYIDSDTECSYTNDVVKLLEKEDTTDLESFLFNPHSFCIIGGDEYEETYELQREMKKTVDYPYFRFADYEDHEADDPCPWREGETYGYTYHWGEVSCET